MTDSREGFAAAVTAAYDRTGAAWAAGPARIYDVLAADLVARSPVALAGRRVLDVGAGTGAASRALVRAGARPVAVDRSTGMLTAATTGDPGRPVAAAGDATALPFATGALDGAVAAFCLNHLHEPADGLRELLRVVRHGGPVLASAYAADDAHPAKAAVDDALRGEGWTPPAWHADRLPGVVAGLATVERAWAAVRRAGLDPATTTVRAVAVPVPGLSPDELVAWRTGMAHSAPFLSGLAPGERRAVHADARRRLGPVPPPLRRSMIVIATVVRRPRIARHLTVCGRPRRADGGP